MDDIKIIAVANKKSDGLIRARIYVQIDGKLKRSAGVLTFSPEEWERYKMRSSFNELREMRMES